MYISWTERDPGQGLCVLWKSLVFLQVCSALFDASSPREMSYNTAMTPVVVTWVAAQTLP